MFVHLLGALKFDTSGGLMPRISYIMTESELWVPSRCCQKYLSLSSFPSDPLRPRTSTSRTEPRGPLSSLPWAPAWSAAWQATPTARPQSSTEKKQKNHPQGWEDGTPPPHRDFKSTIFPLAFAVCPLEIRADSAVNRGFAF